MFYIHTFLIFYLCLLRILPPPNFSSLALLKNWFASLILYTPISFYFFFHLPSDEGNLISLICVYGVLFLVNTVKPSNFYSKGNQHLNVYFVSHFIIAFINTNDSNNRNKSNIINKGIKNSNC